jgi:hypothetical protein
MARGLSVVRGAAAGCVAAALVFGVVLLAGLAEGGSGLVFLVGALAGAVFALIERRETRIQVIGAALVGVGAVVLGALTRFGWLEWSGVLGSVVAIFWVLRGEPRPVDPWRWFQWGGVVLLLLALVLVPLVLDGGTLGHDEAAYGVRARSWLEGTPNTGWSPHRAIGMSVYGYVVLALGGAEPGLRLLGLVATLTMCAGVWALGHRMGTTRAAALASVAVVAGPSLLIRSTEYLSDIPAAAMLVWCMVIVWREFAERDLPSYQLLWVVPFAWAAFYLRYQSSLSLALVALVVLGLWWPKVRQRPGPVLAVVVIGLLGLIPHAMHAISVTGSPLGILIFTSNVAVRAYPGEGLVDYFWMTARPTVGFMAPIAIVTALVGLVGSWRSLPMRQRYLFLLIPAAFQVLVLGVVSHGEPRFVFFPWALVVVAGGLAVDRWIARDRAPSTSAVAWFLAVLLFGSLAMAVSSIRRSVDNRMAVNESVELAALEVADLVGGESCGVLTSYTPQITFYSGCASEIFPTDAAPEDSLDRLRGESRFMVLIENGKRQPQGEQLDGLVDLTTGTPILVRGERRDALVYRFAD